MSVTEDPVMRMYFRKNRQKR